MVVSEGETPTQVITTNVRSFVSQQQLLFNTIWDMAVPCEQRIKELEEGSKPDFVRVISEPAEKQKVISALIKSTKEEILLLFSTPNAFYRQECIGTIKLVEEAAASNPDVKVRILAKIDDRINASLQKLKSNYKFKVVELQTHLQTKVWTLVVDKKFSLETEVKDDRKDNSDETIGCATYSNSESVV